MSVSSDVMRKQIAAGAAHIKECDESDHVHLMRFDEDDITEFTQMWAEHDCAVQVTKIRSVYRITPFS